VVHRDARRRGRPCAGTVSFFRRAPLLPGMRDEEEIREQYEFLKAELDDEEMNHEGVRQMFTYYKRALGWVLEEEYI
jgi:hypothetical protein